MNKDIKNKYYYILYGIKIASNIKIDFIPEFNNDDYFDILNMNVSFSLIHTMLINDISYSFNKEKVVLTIGDNAVYSFSNNYSKLDIVCIDYEYFSATFLNLPFTLYFTLSNKGLLLHASSVCFENKLISFCASKGTGKSTLLYKLISKNNVSFFSDDTLAIRMRGNSIYFSPGAGIIKLNEDVITNDCKIGKGTKNKYSEKYYYSIVNSQNYKNYFNKKIEKMIICFLERKNNSKFIIDSINDALAIKLLLLTNIVGTAVFDYYFQKRVLKSKVFNYLEKNIKFYILVLESNLSLLDEFIERIINKLIKE